MYFSQNTLNEYRNNINHFNVTLNGEIVQDLKLSTLQNSARLFVQFYVAKVRFGIYKTFLFQCLFKQLTFNNETKYNTSRKHKVFLDQLKEK